MHLPSGVSGLLASISETSDMSDMTSVVSVACERAALVSADALPLDMSVVPNLLSCWYLDLLMTLSKLPNCNTHCNYSFLTTRGVINKGKSSIIVVCILMNLCNGITTVNTAFYRTCCFFFLRQDFIVKNKIIHKQFTHKIPF